MRIVSFQTVGSEMFKVQVLPRRVVMSKCKCVVTLIFFLCFCLVSVCVSERVCVCCHSPSLSHKSTTSEDCDDLKAAPIMLSEDERDVDVESDEDENGERSRYYQNANSPEI